MIKFEEDLWFYVILLHKHIYKYYLWQIEK